ncbi:phosphoribosyltransferase [Prochlorococcus marinus]|uniref:Phosphoribosyltransferase n=1 Tax=Prochlorococcus marinus XMU1408 TaxID=2213228 RepID=A0A318RGW4_PROMR|nr:phosphoribosyltransferase [Prochlorococcus marinus]MBW3041867.1 phosphoribosyltransferase [Prochlorococcus marinus str. XMU1408]PYE03003.1 phosphoribosyltransferase [Prochlorococcus marinus XMU1408]
MNKLSWNEFEDCIYSIYTQCKNKHFEGVYGFPRGGLCIAVALSHSLGLPLLGKPKNNCLIVDDIYDSGQTLEQIRHLKGTQTHVWISKKIPTWWNSYKYIEGKEWIVFPWENINAADIDSDLYYQSRA